MASVEMFDHTADVGLRVSAATLDELFEVAAEALFDYVVVNRREVRVVEQVSLSLDAPSPADLLASWLNELLFVFETTHRVFLEFKVRLAADGRSLRAEIGGEPIDRGRHVLDHEVKAVTQHGLALSRSEAGWVAELILDI